MKDGDVGQKRSEEDESKSKGKYFSHRDRDCDQHLSDRDGTAQEDEFQSNRRDFLKHAGGEVYP